MDRRREQALVGQRATGGRRAAALDRPRSAVGSAGAAEHEGRAASDVNLTIWFWGESDAPGANKWLANAVKAYKAAKPNVKIKVVEQATDTFIADLPDRRRGQVGPGHRARSGRPARC